MFSFDRIPSKVHGYLPTSVELLARMQLPRLRFVRKKHEKTIDL